MVGDYEGISFVLVGWMVFLVFGRPGKLLFFICIPWMGFRRRGFVGRVCLSGIKVCHFRLPS